MVSTTKTVGDLSTVTGTAKSDFIILTKSDSDSLNLLGGYDRLEMLGDGNTVSLSNIESIKGSTGVDLVTLETTITGGAINLAGDVDQLTFSDFGGTATVSNIESILGGADTEYLIYGGQANEDHADLGDGNDKILLGKFVNDLTIQNVETVNGSLLTDVITIESDFTGGKIDLAAGNDKIQLGDFGNTSRFRRSSPRARSTSATASMCLILAILPMSSASRMLNRSSAALQSIRSSCPVRLQQFLSIWKAARTS